MPKLHQKNVVRVDLPGFKKDDPGWVLIDKNVNSEAVMAVEDYVLKNGRNLGNTRATIILLSYAIQEWNLQDADGNIAEINQENISKLNPLSLSKLSEFVDLDELNKLPDSKKKPSPSISTGKQVENQVNRQ